MAPFKSDNSSQVEVIVIPPAECVTGQIIFDGMSLAEVVATVRQHINEYPATSPYTSFVLILMTKGSDGELFGLKEVSDYMELSSCLEELHKEGSSVTMEEQEEGRESQQASLAIIFRMELEPYTLHTARHHIDHVKELLQFPPALADGELPEDCNSNIFSDAQIKSSRKNSKKGHQDGKRKKKIDTTVTNSISPQSKKLLSDSLPQQQVSPEACAEVSQQPKEFLRRFKESAIPLDQGLGPFYTLGLDLALEDVAEPLDVPVTPENGGESDQTFHLNVENGMTSQNETRVKCLRWIRPSCWNPPFTQRSLIGDLLYLEVAMLDDIVIHITVTPDGFYVNRTSHGRFDPGPAFNPHFSHELLFTLIRASSAFSEAWSEAVSQARTRSKQPDVLQSTLIQLIRDGCIDSVTSEPQWNVPLSSNDSLTGSTSLPYDGVSERRHMDNLSLNYWRPQDDEYQSLGIIDKGAPRDWNDELQGVKEWDSSSYDKRIIQARAMHKILQEFHSAAIQGAVAIVAGHVVSFNCPESEETSVFVFNNIFFSYAIDTEEGYKVILGAPAAWKSIGRDLRNSSRLLGMQCHDINIIATAIVDYRGRRIVAQGIIPGILRSDNKYALVVGAIEKGQRIKSDPDTLEVLRSIGKVFHIAERDVPDLPIPSVADSSSGRGSNLEEEGPDSISTEEDGANSPSYDSVNDVSAVPLCGPVEMKCLVGTDERKYLLEVLRLTPRDANWVRGEKGTGVYGDMAPPRDENSHVRLTIEDVALLRPELISAYVKLLIDGNTKAPYNSETLNLTIKETANSLDIIPKGERGENTTTNINGVPDGDGDFTQPQLTSDQEKKMEDLVFNVNVFMPFTACTNPKQLLHDEEYARAAAKFLWNVVLPSITSEIRHGRFVPSDGVHMCEQLHNLGINLRYMGRLAQLALKEEQDDDFVSTEAKRNRVNHFPVYWREMLEVEMIARAAKHVFFDLLASSPSARMAPGPTVRIFLNCLVGNGSVAHVPPKSSTPSYSKNSGTAGSSVSSSGNGNSRKKKGNNDVSLSRGFGDVLYKAAVANSDMTHESLWKRLKEEVRDRYRYILEPPSSCSVGLRGASLQLLRRTCQRIGARILSKTYNFQEVEPLGMWDIVDLVPTSKTCQPSTPFQEANHIISEARVNLSNGKLQAAFDLAACAAGAMQQVCSGMHRVYADILHCQGLVLYHANKIEAAIIHEQKALAFYEQVECFDSHRVIMCHRHLSVLYASLNFSTSTSYRILAIAHARTLCYLAELLGGKRHPEVSAIYQHLGRLYMEVGHTLISMKCFEEALKREMDVQTEANLHQYVAKVLAMHKLFKDALKQQKIAWSIWHRLYGDHHPKTQEATSYLEHYTSSAVCHEKNLVDTLRTGQTAATTAEVVKPLGTQMKLSKKMKKKKKKEEAAASAVTDAFQ